MRCVANRNLREHSGCLGHSDQCQASNEHCFPQVLNAFGCGLITLGPKAAAGGATPAVTARQGRGHALGHRKSHKLPSSTTSLHCWCLSSNTKPGLVLPASTGQHQSWQEGWHAAWQRGQSPVWLAQLPSSADQADLCGVAQNLSLPLCCL